MIVLGIDPGAKYTGISVQNTIDETLLLSGTFVKPDDTPIFTWGEELAVLIQQEILSLYPDAVIGIEGLSDPKGYQNGKKSPINPKHVIRTGIVAGILVGRLNPAVVVPPKKNGNSRVGYPPELTGRRPKDLPGLSLGAGTRNHERSAYDVGREVPFLISQGFKLDQQIV